jgi:hypothetical protein
MKVGYTFDMKLQENNKVVAEYVDPYSYLDGNMLAALRKEYVKEIIIRVVIALTVLGCIAVLGFNNYGARTRGDTALAGMVVGIPLYVSYKLLTMKRAIIVMRRRQLIAIYPALHELENLPKTSSPGLTARLISLLWAVLLVVIVGMSLAVWWTDR